MKHNPENKGVNKKFVRYPIEFFKNKHLVIRLKKTCFFASLHYNGVPQTTIKVYGTCRYK